MIANLKPKWAKCSCIVFVSVFAMPILVKADFDEATKAYLLGQFEKARYEALIAATDGNTAAQMLLGQLYFNGEGVEKDIDHALYWYNRSADGGFADAQYRLGILYHDGAPGIEKNLDLAYIYLNQALKSGRKDALERLEWLHKTEQGVVVNLNDDVEVLKQVAASGNQKARFLLSQKMIKGAGVQQDKPAAIKMLREDAEVGFVKAQKQLGELYFYGEGLEKNYVEAYAWSMAYAGTNKLGGIAREGKQVARSALRKLPQETHHDAYVKSKEYFEKFVLPFHKDARPVGPEKYRIVVRSRVKKEEPVTQTAKVTTTNQVEDKKQAKVEKSNKQAVPANKPETTTLTPEQVKPELTFTGKARTTPQSGKTASTDFSDKSAESEVTATSTGTAEKATQQGSESAIAAGDSANQPEDAQPPKSVVETSESGTGPVASREDKEIIPPDPVSNLASAVPGEVQTATMAERDFQEVYNVLVRKKSALYQIYAREYELNKQLEGRIVFDIVIAADGKISSIEVISNTVDSPTLEQSLVDYLKSNVSFVSQEVADFKITYPVDFLPP